MMQKPMALMAAVLLICVPQKSAAQSCSQIARMTGEMGNPFAQLKAQVDVKKGVILYIGDEPVFSAGAESCEIYGPSQGRNARGDDEATVECIWDFTSRAEAEALYQQFFARFSECLTAPPTVIERDVEGKKVAFLKIMTVETENQHGYTEARLRIVAFPRAEDKGKETGWVPDHYWLSLGIVFEAAG